MHADKLSMNVWPTHRTIPRPDRFVPTWIFPEEQILAGLAGLDDEMLQAINIGRFCIGLKARIEEKASGT